MSKNDRLYFLMKEIYYYEHKFARLTESEKQLLKQYREEYRKLKK